jgi:hypothetical protein
MEVLEAQMASPTFWDSPERAQGVVMEIKNLRKVIEPLKEVVSSCIDLEELLQMSDGDPAVEQEIESELARLEQTTEQLEIRSLLNGPNDDCGAILSVHAREGGLDANDWAEMLLGMYTAWAQQRGFSVELLDRSDDETAGITQATCVENLLTDTSKGKKASTVWFASALTMPKVNARRVSPPSTFPRKSMIQSISISRRKTFEKTSSEPQEPVDST